jgi:hypothetical protein
MSKIKRLKVNNFRGVIQETLDLDGCSLVILGENGTGKSSFIDALEFYFTGKVSHLEGAQGISTARHAPHILASEKDTSVTIEFVNDNLSATRTFDNDLEVPDELYELHNQGANATFILRRKNLLDFILAQPASRYDQLAAIIGVEELDKVERSLMQIRDDVENEAERLLEQVKAEEQKLLELIGETDFSDDQILATLNQKLTIIEQSPLDSFSSIERRKLQIVKGGHAPADLERSVKLQNLITKCGLLLEITGIFDSNQALWESIDQLHKDTNKIRDLLFEEVLRSSNRLLSHYSDIENCPVCLQPINYQELVQALEKRIQNLEPIAELARKIKKQGTKFRDSAQQWVDLFGDVKNSSDQLGISWNSSALSTFQELTSNISASVTAEPADLRLEPLEQIKSLPTIPNAVQSIRGLMDLIQSEKAKSEPTEEDKKALQAIELITRVADARQALSALRPQLHGKAITHQEIVNVYETFVSTKRIEVQRIYSELQEDIRGFFSVLHPDEGYKEVRLAVNEGKRASTEIRMDFYNRSQEDPRAFNSEGHLDSLGLCVFLAFVKRFNAGFPIIALDDVVSSIDSGHRQRVCDLLFDKFPDAQWFITTHDYVWYEELHAYQIAHGLNSKFKNLQILNWALEEGPKINPYKSRWTLIDEKLTNGDKDGAAASIRKELEAFLMEITISLQARVPIKRDGKYTVGDLHDPLVSHFKKRIPDVYKNKEDVFKNLQVNGIFGNLLTHNNPQAGNASIDEVRNFADAIRQFEDVFVCPKCKTIVIYYQDAKIIRCKCKENGLLWATKD